jgi:hypothetical protein
MEEPVHQKTLKGSNLINEILLISGSLAIINAILYSLFQAVALNE